MHSKKLKDNTLGKMQFGKGVNYASKLKYFVPIIFSLSNITDIYIILVPMFIEKFIINFWRGNLKLWHSFWLVGGFGGIIQYSIK